MKTLNQIIDQIKDLADNHYQIAEVGVGTVAELQSKPDRSYPLLWLSIEDGFLDENYKVDNIRLTMFGRVIVGEEGQDDDASELEVLSDMQSVLLDFYNYFHQQHNQEYVTDKLGNLEPFTERTNDRTAGYSGVLEIKQFYEWNKCWIPESGASIPPTVDGLTLYDFCDQSVLDRLTPTQTACLQAEFGTSIQIQINGVDSELASTSPYNQRVQNSAGTAIGTAANPSVVPDARIGANGNFLSQVPATVDSTIDVHDTAGSDVGSDNGTTWEIGDTTIRNQANDWSDTELAEGTYTLGLQRVVDSDGSNVDTVDYKPIADGAVFTCTPADYGTRILSVFRREFCITSVFGFGLSYLDDEFATAGSDVILVRRSSDSAQEGFTPTEITDGTLTTWVGAGNDGYVVKFYDHTLNGFALYNTNAAYQGYIVKSGSLVVDSQGNPTVELRSTQGYLLGSDAHNTGYMPFWNTNSTCWAVQKLATGASQAWLLTISGNPSFARVGSGSFPNSINCGSPVTKVNDTVLADQNWDTLMTATENIEAIVNTIDIDFSQRTQWSQNAAVKFGLSYPVGSFLSELAVTFRDASSQQDYIFDDRNAYYGYY